MPAGIAHFLKRIHEFPQLLSSVLKMVVYEAPASANGASSFLFACRPSAPMSARAKVNMNRGLNQRLCHKAVSKSRCVRGFWKQPGHGAIKHEDSGQ